MTLAFPVARTSLSPDRRGAPAPAVLCAALLVAFLLSGCINLRPGRVPERTVVVVTPAEVPAQVVANFFIAESRQDDGRTHRFLIDTGSSITLVSPELAREIRAKDRRLPTRSTVRVRGAHGGEADLEAVTLRRLRMGENTFERVPALVYDLADLSAHLGFRISGIIGFPVFREVQLTLDYPRQRMVIAPRPAQSPALDSRSARESVVAFNNEQNSPLIPLQMGNESFVVLIDTGSDSGLSLNPVGLHPRFLHGPREGILVASLNHDRHQLVGRLAQDILLGSHVVATPVTDLTDQLSSIGGELLRHFTVIFDQPYNRVTFIRDEPGPVVIPPRRSTGLSFLRSPVYWRIASIVPDSPATGRSLQNGDLCVRINGEPVAQWDYERYARLIRTATKITYTFLSGTTEFDQEIPVFELVP